MFTFVIIGLATGAVYGMSGVGLVLTYRTSNVFNFAYGAVGTLAAYVFYSLNFNDGIAWPFAAAISVILIGVLGGLAFSRLAKPLATAPLTMQVAATVGVMLIIEAVCSIIYGQATLEFPSYLSSAPISIFGTQIGRNQVVVFVVASVLTAALAFVLKRTRLGMQMRAVVEGSTLLGLSGANPGRIRALAWIIGTGFAAIAGLLIAPSINLSPEILTLLVVQAYAAAALGLFKNIGWTFAGGLLVGVLSALCTYWATSSAIIADIAPGIPFALLLIVLFVVPKGRLPRPRLIAQPGRKRPSWKLHTGIAVPLGIALLLVPQFAESRLTAYAGAVAVVILFLALGLLVRESGQVSLAHVSFAAIGAAALGHLAGHGVPWGFALIIAGLVAVPFGALLAIPAIRHGGLYLALATFGFGLVLEETFYSKSIMLGLASAGITVPLPNGGILVSNSNYYLFLAIAAVISVLVTLLLTGRLGRFLNAFGQSPLALLTSGLNTTVLQVSIFCVSAFIAGIAGALYGTTLGVATGSSFDPFTSLVYVTLIVIAAGQAPWYAWVAGLSIVLIPEYVGGANTPEYLNILFGVFAIGAAIAPSVAEALDLQRRLAGVQLPWRSAAIAGEGSVAAFGAKDVLQSSNAELPQLDAARQARAAESEAVLELRDVSVRFGGLVAVDDLSLKAKRGAITALIGPNGAGKTTSFNATSGLVGASSGSVMLNERDVTRIGTSHRSRLGLSRTFQEMNLFDGMSVRENIAVVTEAQDAGALPWRQLLPRWKARREVAAQVENIANLCNLEEVIDKPAGQLSTAQRRLVDLARALMASPNLLLLDEPLSGLDIGEGEALMQLLRRLCDERGVAILVVEHDMEFVVKMADYVYVLDFGRLIFEGDASHVMESEVVRAAYIGGGVGEALEETA